MSQANQPTRLDRLVLENFRCFRSLDLTFDQRLTVIVASNGGGKTAVLDAVALAWRLFVDTIQTEKASNGFDHADIRLEISAQNTMEVILPTSFTASGFVENRPCIWSGKIQSHRPKAKTSFADARCLIEVAQSLRKQYQVTLDNRTLDVPVFPAIAYYGTGRLFGEHNLRQRKKEKVSSATSRYNGYEDCLSASSRYKFFVNWFERFSREAQQEITSGQNSPHVPQLKLQAVKDAVDLVLKPSGWHDLKWDFAEDIITAQHSEHGTLPVDSLSDGIRNMIGLVADIAHRCVSLNPQFNSTAARETPGVVLIDEVDMHLHPEWQQVVTQALLDAFPRLQFIVTTHSPQVLTTVRKENIRKLLRDEAGVWSADQPTQSPLARESSDALAFVMGAHPRPRLALLDDIHAYEQLARSGKSNSPRAQAIRDRLDDAGFEFNDAELKLFDFLASRSGHPSTEDSDG
jgi:predicted ATP-binding protein involved in virulence